LRLPGTFAAWAAERRGVRSGGANAPGFVVAESISGAAMTSSSS
jgi:hypothetical protein